MTRNQFLKTLNKALKKIKKSERRNYLNHYDELISDLMENGMSEQDAIERQGSVKAIAAEILENIEADKLKHRDWMLIGLVTVDVILVGVNLWQVFLKKAMGVTLISGSGSGTSISIIGGADGPTNIFVAARLSPWQNGWLILMICALVATVIYFIIKKRKNRIKKS